MEKIKRRNRKRSKRRPIYCPEHDCYLDSTSRKYHLFADRSEHLRQRGISRKRSLFVFSSYTTVPLTGEWLEAFWCRECQEARWFHVRRCEGQPYDLSIAPRELWMQVGSVPYPTGNPSVGDFTWRKARKRGGMSTAIAPSLWEHTIEIPSTL